ncbi:polysaccharide deacetylase family protein [Granulosicoccus sp. 3-233]|uniref:polysaccharide deacetylase family protein n=1 Tax=Granulosicoccus sp. 3-233 TaxID=3417969 RepID=UPI003D32CBBB
MNRLRPGQAAVVSIHDVMPETMDPVQRCLDECYRHDVRNVHLLVVPGRRWSASQLQQLRHWVSEGCLLAGHGWLHHCDNIDRPYHRLHSMLMSRNVAEHLALDAGGIVTMMNRCRQWFALHQLPSPDLYVPPAWALGRIDQPQLRSTGFGLVETVRGVVDLHAGQWKLGPLLGYEADTVLRSRVLSAWNRANRRMAALNGTVRIGIHPQDLELRLSEELRSDLALCQSITLDEVFAAPVLPELGQTESR